MPRFFTDNIGDTTITIVGEDARHISRSLRCKIGESLTVCDGKGMDYTCQIKEICDDSVLLQIDSSQRSIAEPPVEIVLYQAIPKSDKLELIVQKAVELGASKIVPLVSEFCVSRPDDKSASKKADRLNKIAAEAAKQCGRAILPQVDTMLTYKQAVNQMKQSELAIMFYEHATDCLGKVLFQKPKSIAVLIGSEGGFSQSEVQYALDNGVSVCTMGPRILRCETAAFYALSAITYEYENREL